MRLILTYLSLFPIICFGQLPPIAVNWENITIEKFDLASFDDLSIYDYSKVISNQLRIERDPWSTYIGVFGPKNHRIDFHLTATRIDNDTYAVKGKSKLNQNIREITGEVNLRRFLRTPWLATIVLFEYKLNEPGDKEGDGSFIGIGTTAFMIKNGQPTMFWSEAGDFREYNNMFVGIWKRYNSNVTKECIFSFAPSGTNTFLPYRDYFYKEFEDSVECPNYFEIKNAYRKYGWENYDDFDHYKDYWWK